MNRDYIAHSKKYDVDWVVVSLAIPEETHRVGNKLAYHFNSVARDEDDVEIPRDLGNVCLMSRRLCM